MDRIELSDDIEELGAVSVETQGGGGLQLDTDNQFNLGIGIAKD